MDEDKLELSSPKARELLNSAIFSVHSEPIFQNLTVMMDTVVFVLWVHGILAVYESFTKGRKSSRQHTAQSTIRPWMFCTSVVRTLLRNEIRNVVLASL